MFGIFSLTLVSSFLIFPHLYQALEILSSQTWDTLIEQKSKKIKFDTFVKLSLYKYQRCAENFDRYLCC